MSTFRGGGGGWSGFGAYMRDKTIKLAGQFDDRFEKRTDIFAGKTFWSTGRIEGIDFDIKEVLTENGGEYQQYGFRNVSHIIASNLALSNQNWKKLLGGKFTSKTYHVVTPQWIVDSVSVGKALPEVDYIPECIRVRGGLKDFFGNSKSIVPIQHRDASSDTFTLSPDGEQYDKRLHRLELKNPIDGAKAVEELCYAIVSIDIGVNSLARRAHVGILSQDGSFITLNVLFLTPTTSLAKALLETIGGKDMCTVVNITLTLFTKVGDGPSMELFSGSTETPPTALNSRLTTLGKLLVNSTEDDIDACMLELLRSGGPCVGSIVLDSFHSVVRARRLDVARNIIFTLRKRVFRGSTSELASWYHEIELKARETFRWHNNGAELVL